MGRCVKAQNGGRFTWGLGLDFVRLWEPVLIPLRYQVGAGAPGGPAGRASYGPTCRR